MKTAPKHQMIMIKNENTDDNDENDNDENNDGEKQV